MREIVLGGDRLAKTFSGCLPVPEMSERCRCWRLERTFIRGCPGGRNLNMYSEDGGGDDCACDSCFGGPRVPQQIAGEEEGKLEHNGETR